MRTKLHLSTALAVVVAGLTLVAAPASAAVPANDTIAKATPISSLPYSVERNTTDATKSDTDPRPSCDGGIRDTVWWTMTATSSGWLAADTLGSRYDTVAAIYTGSPDALTEVACNDDSVRNGDWKEKARVYWQAQAGTSYYLLVAAGSGRGGALELRVDHSETPFTVESFVINPKGDVDKDTNTVTVSGTITCTGDPGRVGLEMYIRQRIGRDYITAGDYRRITCDGATPWKMRFSSWEHVFSGGALEVYSYLYWYEGNGGQLTVGPTTVHLTG